MNCRTMAIAAMLVLAACSGADDPESASAPTALVQLARARDGSVASSRTVYGAVELTADTQITLSAPVEAIVSRIAAPLGSAVEQGQLVVALSPSPSASAEMARLAADARSAQQAYERALRLRDDGLVSDAEVESARATALAAEASRAAIATQSGQLALRAPEAGNVLSIASNPGDLVGPGTTIVTISRQGDLRARFGIDPALLARLSQDAGVSLPPGSDGQAITLPILSVDPSVDPRTRLASIFVSVPAAYRSGAGQPLKGEVTLEQSGRAIVIPYAALLDDGGQPFVFVVSGDVAHRRDVTIGASDGTTVAILNGVEPGDQVVTAGGTALEDGMKVRTE